MLLAISNQRLTVIYLDLQPVIVSWLIGSLGMEKQEAEDVFHDGILKFRRNYDGKRKPLNYLVSICKHIVINLWKHKAVHTANEPQIAANTDPDPDPLTELIAEHDRQRQHAEILNSVSGRAYTVARLSLEGTSHREICELTGMTSNGVYHMMSKIYRDCR